MYLAISKVTQLASITTRSCTLPQTNVNHTSPEVPWSQPAHPSACCNSDQLIRSLAPVVEYISASTKMMVAGDTAQQLREVQDFFLRRFRRHLTSRRLEGGHFCVHRQGGRVHHIESFTSLSGADFLAFPSTFSCWHAVEKIRHCTLYDQLRFAPRAQREAVERGLRVRGVLCSFVLVVDSGSTQLTSAKETFCITVLTGWVSLAVMSQSMR